jgi:EpsD family peptidyl-prolyl cis-trans isomerase
MMDSSRLPRPAAFGPGAAVLAATLALAALLAGCGKKHDATQAAARVDGAEITVHDINYRLLRERGLRPERKSAEERRLLELLINEQLFVAKAERDKIDKDPVSAQALDAARRDVLARAFVEQVIQAVKPPTDDAVRRYYEDNGALFAQRRIYTLHEYLAVVPAARQPELKALVEGGKPQEAVVAWFKANGVAFRDQQATRPAEQIPLASLKTLLPLRDGQGLIATAGDHAHLTYLASSVSQPVDLDRARPEIVAFMTRDARRKAVDAARNALTSSAKITYAAAYQSLAASGPALSTTKDVNVSAEVGPASDARVSLPAADAGSAVQVALPQVGYASGVQVSLPASDAAGVRVSLPNAPSSSVEVRLPPQGGESGKK